MSNINYIFKVLIAGTTGVGKTTAVSRFVDEKFTADTTATIGVNFCVKLVTLGLGPNNKYNLPITLKIWDIAVENRFRSIIPYYITNTQGVILTFDSTNTSTLTHLNEWIEVIKLFLENETPFILISTKHDLKSSINNAELEQFMTKYAIKYYYPTSSLTGENINDAFYCIAKLIATTGSNRIDLSLESSP